MPAEAEKIRQEYARRKARARDRAAKQVEAGQDIGAIPAIADPGRRMACARSFQLFCETYFVDRFYLAWSDDHLKAIGRIEAVVLRGGQLALAMPRGSGKSALIEVALLWAVLYGHHQMAAGLAATKPKSLEMMESVTIALETNELLGQDFPEVCYPIRQLGGTANKAAGQTYLGERTRIRWTKDEIVLPFIPGSPAAGAIVKVGGLTGGAVRGMKHNRPDGSIVRPSLVLLDDPQTDATARSLSQNERREKLVAGAVLGMAGPDRKIAALLACTVIQPDDLSDRMLNPESHPHWQGLRTKLIYAFPSNEKLWEEYYRILADGLRKGDEGRTATEFYRHRQAAMDAGAEVAWPARFDETEISAVQYAMNLKFRNATVFFAEYQNEPAAAVAASVWATTEQIMARTNGLKRGAVPVACNYVTMYIDVHDKLLYWCIAAWQDNFTGYVIDYGAYPDQPKRYFALREATKTLSRACQGAGRKGAIYAGLKAVCDEHCARVFKRDDGAELPMGWVMIDANWGEETDTVHKFIREYPARNVLPAKSVGLTSVSAAWEDRASKPGERTGDHWRMAKTPNGTARGRHVVIDTNHWKTVVQRSLVAAPGDPGAITLFARDDASRVAGAEYHRLFAEHLTAEAGEEKVNKRTNRPIVEWRQARPDNHWFDCLVGSAVLAGMSGASSIGPVAPSVPKKPAAPKRPARPKVYDL